MKLVRVNFAVLIALSLFLGACGGSSDQASGGEGAAATTEQVTEGHDHDHDHDHASEAADGKTKGKEYTSAYVCPMHCQGSGSDEAGNCPVCGMDYVARADHEANGHTHDDM